MTRTRSKVRRVVGGTHNRIRRNARPAAGNSVDTLAETVFTKPMTTTQQHFIERENNERGYGAFYRAHCTCGWSFSTNSSRGLTHSINSHQRAAIVERAKRRNEAAREQHIADKHGVVQ